RITYDGSVQEERGVVAMGGQAESISGGLRANRRTDMSLAQGLKLAVDALGSVGGENGKPRNLAANQLEVAVLDRQRSGRTFRRIVGLALSNVLENVGVGAEEKPAEEPAEPSESSETPSAETPSSETPSSETPSSETPADAKDASSPGDRPQPPSAPGTPADNASGKQSA